MAAFPVNAALTGKAALLRYTNRYFLPEGRAALAPTRENVARVIAEKDAALAAMDAACPVHDERFRWLRGSLWFHARPAAGASDDGVLSPRDVLRIEDVSHGDKVAVRGVVTFVSVIDRRFVVAPQDNPRHAGVVVLPTDGIARPENGDLVFVAGRLQRHAGLPAVEAGRVDVIRGTTQRTAALQSP